MRWRQHLREPAGFTPRRKGSKDAKKTGKEITPLTLPSTAFFFASLLPLRLAVKTNFSGVNVRVFTVAHGVAFL
jgi:hypothetical protein